MRAVAVSKGSYRREGSMAALSGQSTVDGRR
jgi:hypothetical protein